MTKILFICLGNICRSPMAEFVMKQKVHEAGLDAEFEIASAATSDEEHGNPVYPPARRVMNEHGIDCSGKHARQMNSGDYKYYDMLICMDKANLRDMQYMIGGDPDGKMSMLMDYTERPGNVADPFFTRNFEITWDDVNEGCDGLLQFILEK